MNAPRKTIAGLMLLALLAPPGMLRAEDAAREQSEASLDELFGPTPSPTPQAGSEAAEQESEPQQDKPVSVIELRDSTPEPSPPPKRKRPGLIDEIVVTAQKREQAAFDVPMSISAIGGETLEKMGADGAKDIALSTPSFSVSESAPGSQTFQMRGISSLAIGTRATVGYYLDDVSLTALPGFQLDAGLYDIERVEVLRGPQGTLYGEGSMGGTLKLITAAPDASRFATKARLLSYRTDDGADSHEAYGALNVPLLTDRLAARLVVTKVDQGGYIDQTERSEPDANFADKQRVRLRLGFAATNWLDVDGLFLRQELTSGSLNFADDNYERQDHTLPGSDDTASIYGLKLTPSLSWADVLLSYAYSDRLGHFVTDGRQAVGNIVQLTGDPTLDALLQQGALAATDEVPSDVGIDSQTQIADLRLHSATAGKLFWTGGLYLRDAAETNLVYLAIVQEGQEVASLADYTHRIDSRQYAVYGQLEYDLLPWLNITGGLRYFRDRGTSDLNGTLQEQDATNHDEFDFSTVNPRLVASFRGPNNWFGFANETLAYISASKGFRSGGANRRFASESDNDSAVFEPDSVWTYELGGKTVLWDGLLSVETAVFYNDWRNVQLTTNVDGGFFTANSGNSRGVGVDWNLVWRPLHGLSLSFSGNVIDAEFTTSTAEKEPGDPLDFVPPRSASLAIEYDFDWLSGTSWLLRTDYNFQDENRFLSRSAGFDTTSDPIRMLNARIGMQRANWQLYLFGRNLLDFRGVITDSGNESTVRPRPINLGVELKLEL